MHLGPVFGGQDNRDAKEERSGMEDFDPQDSVISLPITSLTSERERRQGVENCAAFFFGVIIKFVGVIRGVDGRLDCPSWVLVLVLVLSKTKQPTRSLRTRERQKALVSWLKGCLNLKYKT